MIDTLRLRGPAKDYNMKLQVTKYQVWVNEETGNVTNSPIVTLSNVKDKDGQSLYRIFYTPSADMVEVELNVQKILFSNNATNYCFSAPVLNLLVRRVGAYFFASGSYFVTRIDLGFVQTMETEDKKRAQIDTFRNTRLPGSYAAKYKAQYYANSVWYMSKNWVMKIYDKHAEITKHDSKERANELVPNNNMVRYEKQFRGKEIERVSEGRMKYEPFKGIHIDSFDVTDLKENLFETLADWARNMATIEGQQLKGTAGLLDVLAKKGLLSEVETSGVVNRSTIHRYKKKAQKIGVVDYSVTPDIISEAYKNRVSYAVSVGFAKILNDRTIKK